MVTRCNWLISQNFVFMCGSSSRLPCWGCFSLVLHCRSILVEKNLFLQCLLYLCANPGPTFSQVVAVETALLFQEKAFERGVALKSSLLLHIVSKPRENISDITKTSKLNVFFLMFSTRCQLLFKGITLWLLTQVEVWKIKWLYQACNVKHRGCISILERRYFWSVWKCIKTVVSMRTFEYVMW